MSMSGPILTTTNPPRGVRLTETVNS